MSRDPPGASADGPARIAADVLNVVIPIIFFAMWIMIYGELNQLGARPGAAATFGPPLDLYPWLYQPWLAYPYALGGLVLPGLPFLFNWGRQGLVRVLCTYTIGSACCFAVYAVYPVVIARPTYLSGRPGEDVMRTIVGLDQPANCLPSAHAYFAVAAALLMNRSNRLIRTLVWILSGTVVISTVAVGQHYIMDAAAGAALGVVSWFIVRARMKPRRHAG